MKLLETAILFAGLLAVSCGESVGACKPTTTDLVVTECMQNPTIQFDSSSIVLVPYPPKPDEDINITISYTNNGPEIDAFTLEVENIQFYGNLFFKCGWHVLDKGPIKEDGCSSAGCPINAGKTDIHGKLDLKKFAGIISLLGGDKYFKFDLKFVSSAGTDLTCATVQIYIKKD